MILKACLASGALLAAAALSVDTSHQAKVPRLVAQVDLSIGGPDEARDPYIFSDIRGLALDPTGHILVADSKDQNVRVFSATGVHLYTFGRQGQGPGDFLGPCCIAFDRSGRLWVKDFGNRRYAAFRLTQQRSQFQYSIRGTGNPLGYFDRVAWDNQGHLVDVTTPLSGSGFERSFLDSAGTVVRRDTVPGPPSDSIASWTYR